MCFPRFRENHFLSLCVTGQRISEPERGLEEARQFSKRNAQKLFAESVPLTLDLVVLEPISESFFFL